MAWSGGLTVLLLGSFFGYLSGADFGLGQDHALGSMV